jgi:hypothetical protein
MTGSANETALFALFTVYAASYDNICKMVSLCSSFYSTNCNVGTLYVTKAVAIIELAKLIYDIS